MRTKLMAGVVALVALAGSAGAQAPQAAKKDKGAKATQQAGKTEVTWWGHAGFFIRTPGGAVLAIDPWLANPKAPQGAQAPEALDAILVTHGHFDHAGSAKALAEKTGAPVYGSFELVNQLGV